jgi:hypothetical protein
VSERIYARDGAGNQYMDETVPSKILASSVDISAALRQEMELMASELAALRNEKAELAAKLAEREAFKSYTHQRMTEAGVPHEVPESPHTAAGCRIGGRFDWLLKQLEDARKDFHAQWIQKMKVVDAVKTPDKLFASQLECAAADAVRDLQAKLAAAESREAALREGIEKLLATARYNVETRGRRPLWTFVIEQLSALLSRPTEPTKEDGDVQVE